MHDISIPDSFVYTCYKSCMHDISIPDSFVYRPTISNISKNSS